ncbi:hypothetical protein SNE26_22655 [Mucilaginibacter sp. cycad4]|uniref:hypothetical protein n=1 Tax=Mucilaginibacter sp. cycad4 TaxID=3342096 RepID=UPI002AAB9D6D|nr:hypothetical protein [Mucilaginibacter gossypii]WPU98820.1 hypothetical protein SNE26_22655 [Mucilaginibacter gossypii]
MKKNKLVILLGALLLTAGSSCGIFHKGCGCPHFGKIKSADSKCTDVQMMA